MPLPPELRCSASAWGLQLFLSAATRACLRDEGADADGDASEQAGGPWVDGSGIMRGSCTRLESSRLKVPHVGWDQVHMTPAGAADPLLAGFAEGANMYFTHSYAVADDADAADVSERARTIRGASRASCATATCGAASSIPRNPPRWVSASLRTSSTSSRRPADDPVSRNRSDRRQGRAPGARRPQPLQGIFRRPCGRCPPVCRAGRKLAHVVDLSAAFGEDEDACAANSAAIKAICGVDGLSVDVGGGVRSLARIDELAGYGARRIALGHRARDRAGFCRGGGPRLWRAVGGRHCRPRRPGSR